MKTMKKSLLLLCALAAGSVSAVDMRLTLGWPPAAANLGSAARFISENALPMKHSSKHSLDMTGTGSWAVNGENYDKMLGLDLSYSYDIGNGFFVGLDGGIGGRLQNAVNRNDDGKVQASNRSLNIGLYANTLFAGYFTQLGKLGLTNLMMLEGVEADES
ncbi:MAG: hypothetical protein PVJ92_02295, partial [Candidatus Dependentiae bacterium]